MVSEQLGKIEKVDLREVWKNEATDFTPWLENNLPALNEALGMELEIQRREAPVGSFSLDLLAKDLSTNRTAVIENQLTESDHGHFGQLLLYASGYDADIVIWLAEEIRPEHRQALDWLNQRTGEGTEFFGIVVELLKIDGSRPAPNFKLIAFPNEWRKTKISEPPSPPSQRAEAYRTYFQKLIDELREQHKFTSARAAQPSSYYSFSSGSPGIRYGASFAERERARTDVYIDRRDTDWNKSLFDELAKIKESLEDDLGSKLEWERLDSGRASRIAIYRPGTIDDDQETLEEIKTWMVERLLKFKEVFGPKLAEFVG